MLLPVRAATIVEHMKAAITGTPKLVNGQRLTICLAARISSAEDYCHL